MTKILSFVLSIIVSGIVLGQQPAIPLQPARMFPPPGAAISQVQPVVNLGNVVINVVIAKVLKGDSGLELTIAKFGGKEADSTSLKNATSYIVETRTRTVIVGGKPTEVEYQVNVPVTTAVKHKKNFTPTEQHRSISVDLVQAFDLNGNPVDRKEWTKRLETPRHVLLLKEPIDESNKLNPFYAPILREDTLLLFLAAPEAEVQDNSGRMTMRIYDVSDLSIFSKDGRPLDPSGFSESIKSNVTPDAWQVGASLRELRAKESIVVAAPQATHQALSEFLKQLRDNAKEEK